eukprot:Rhum_TRINITY_DN14970_c8_g4::Rhum_TRINITY_DN14970_c8_g4_i2::g.130338::m.130338
MEIDGQIDAWVPIVGQVKIRNVIPQKFEEYPLEATRCKVDKKVSCASASIYGDTGYMYRRMDLNYDLEHAPEYPLPFQTLIRCSNDVSEVADVAALDCVPDYKHVLPLYHRLFCVPLVVCEKFLGMFQPPTDADAADGAVVPRPPRALVLGLGGGAWAGLLRDLYPTMQIDCVEIEPAVVQHAQKHFGFVPGALTSVVVQDAEVFLKWKAEAVEEGRAEPYDVAFVDVYSSGDTPACMEKLSFYEDLDAVMAPKSAVGIHLNTRVDEAYHAWKAQSLFYGKNSMVMRYAEPNMLAASVLFSSKGWQLKDPLNLNFALFRLRARQWSFEHGLPFDAGRKFNRAATPCFPGIRHVFNASRSSQRGADAVKDEVKGRMQASSSATS